MQQIKSRQPSIRRFLALRLASLVTAAVLLSTAPDNSWAAGQNDRPNIILIMLDDLGYGDMGAYGQTRIKTPNMDRLASEGMRFTQWYAGVSICAPSRCTLMTGYHTGNARIRANSPIIDLLPEDVTVAEVLKPEGYTTAMFGKWGLGDRWETGMPTQQGFDEWFGFPTQTSGWDCFPETLAHNGALVPIEENKGGRTFHFADDLFAEKAIEFVNQNSDLPFFIYLAFISPHPNRVGGVRGMFAPTTEPYSEEDWPEAEKNYAAVITRIDGHIGRLMDELARLDLDRQTVIILTSDNGTHKVGGHDESFFKSSGPFRGYKWDWLEGGQRVPMVIRWPGRIAAAVDDGLWAHWDVLPTIASLAGAKAPDGIDGISVGPSLLGESQERRHEYLYWEYHHSNFTQVLRTGDWKAVREGPGAPMVIFNLKEDPQESTDVSAREPAVVRRIESLLDGARTESELWPVSPSLPIDTPNK